ncbi:MAG: hypothetical protein B7Y12_00690 [Rhizobiales bacterium 24-66-13]|nr:MAG: hypothetical protein B7Y95_04150 [Rhizobiales bacterium 32-66-11]OYZ83118.1 MAG: hypothetical protein B7Y12_00690 [Rhizobiales bacterium 24-66-13]OZB12048.1 MAG: hypothetical protein B7X67_01275 [Rhizobiales bacterium 39-66-18]
MVIGCAATILAAPTPAAFADGIMPKTYRERERHMYRDVQRGVGHPADTPTQQVVRPSKPFVFPWDFLFEQPNPSAIPGPAAPAK